MKNLTIENITRACRGTYHGSDNLLSREAAHVVIDSLAAMEQVKHLCGPPPAPGAIREQNSKFDLAVKDGGKAVHRYRNHARRAAPICFHAHILSPKAYIKLLPERSGSNLQDRGQACSLVISDICKTSSLLNLTFWSESSIA